MNKLAVLAVTTAFCVAGTTALAESWHHYGGGAPQGFGANLNTVQLVKSNARDDQYVTLRGRLVDYLGHDHYEFADNTGTIEVELDDDYDWSYISKGEFIELSGKVDKDFFSTTIDVRQIVSLEKGPAAQGMPAPQGPQGMPAPQGVGPR